MTPARRAISVVIADDPAIVRTDLFTFLGDQSDIRIVGDASTPDSIIALIARESADIAVVGVRTAELGAKSLPGKIAAAGLATRVIVIGDATDEDDFAARALEQGVMGFLPAHALEADLHGAIRAVHDGAPFYHDEIRAKLPARKALEGLPHDSLTGREKDILKELAKGRTNKQISSALALTEGTVKGYVSTVLSKLCVDDRIQAALYAVRHGLA